MIVSILAPYAPAVNMGKAPPNPVLVDRADVLRLSLKLLVVWTVRDAVNVGVWGIGVIRIMGV